MIATVLKTLIINGISSYLSVFILENWELTVVKKRKAAEFRKFCNAQDDP